MGDWSSYFMFMRQKLQKQLKRSPKQTFAMPVANMSLLDYGNWLKNREEKSVKPGGGGCLKLFV